MPDSVPGTPQIMRFLAREISPHTCVNLMAQYYPAGRVSTEKFTGINRRITSREYAAALTAARAARLHALKGPEKPIYGI